MPKSAKKAVHKIPGTEPPYIRTTNNSNKEYEEIRCTICMEHPHNATLLICSSHDKGCRAYMCNSPIQSDCLAKYRATSAASRLRCPLCRGHVSEERVVEPRARVFMDSKERECRKETCGFVGARRELMWHWWECHMGDDVAEEREREWQRREREWEMRVIEALIGKNRFVPLWHATPAIGATSAVGATSAFGGGGATRVRRGARMSVSGHLMGRRLATPDLPAACL